MFHHCSEVVEAYVGGGGGYDPSVVIGAAGDFSGAKVACGDRAV